MDDLSILPEGVREHVEIMDARNTVNGSWNAIRAELLRLAAVEQKWKRWINDGMRVVVSEQPK